MADVRARRMERMLGQIERERKAKKLQQHENRLAWRRVYYQRQKLKQVAETTEANAA